MRPLELLGTLANCRAGSQQSWYAAAVWWPNVLTGIRRDIREWHAADLRHMDRLTDSLRDQIAGRQDNLPVRIVAWDYGRSTIPSDVTP